jgi:RND family efflux transporter MFP subunit
MKYEHKKSLSEFKSKAVEATFKLEAAKATAKAKEAKAKFKVETEKKALKMQQDRLNKMMENLTKFEMAAPHSGTLAYANREYWDSSRKISEGATVYQNQLVFYLPDLKNMQVKVGIHESLVSKIKKDQPATIRIDAFANRTFTGKVKSVAPLAESSWYNASKNYNAIVTIDGIPDDVILKPGMTAQVEILTGVYPQVVAVPVQAVASHAGKKYVYVESRKDNFQRQEVQIGRSNTSFVEIVSGVKAGEIVALDSFQRGTRDFGDVQAVDETTDEAVTATGAERVSEDTVHRQSSELNSNDSQLREQQPAVEPAELKPTAAPEVDVSHSSSTASTHATSEQPGDPK